MPSIDFHSIANFLLGGFGVTFVALWLSIYLTGVRDLHDNSPKRLHNQGGNASLEVRTGPGFCR
ncbi:MAG TPA: hypothetical protein VFC10_12620 [Terriglobia bacterium]|nr:hypothetical protein [Terriglobia bacterium]